MLKRKQIGLFLTWIYVFLIFATSDNSMLFAASAILAAAFFLTCMKGRMIYPKGSPYFILGILFIFYALFQIGIGVAVLKAVSWSTARKMMLNLVDEWMLFNILIEQKDLGTIFDTLIYPYCLGILLIIALQYRAGDLFSHRLSAGTDIDVTYHFLGLTINAGVATIIGHCAICALAFALFSYIGTNKIRYIFFIVIAAVGLLLTSSRKAIAVAIILLLIAPELRNHSKKRLWYICGSLILLGGGYLAVLKIPFLYSLVGKRIQRMLISLSTGDTVDSSMDVRRTLRNLAWNAFLQRPIEGWGLNSFKDLFNNGERYTHCNYLEILVGTGLIGMIIFFARYVYLLIRSLYLMQMSAQEKYYGKCIFVWIVLVLVMEYWQVAYYNERMVVHYIFVLAMMEWMQRRYHLRVPAVKKTKLES